MLTSPTDPGIPFFGNVDENVGVDAVVVKLNVVDDVFVFIDVAVVTVAFAFSLKLELLFREAAIAYSGAGALLKAVGVFMLIYLRKAILLL
jgi:hypothetical protein